MKPISHFLGNDHSDAKLLLSALLSLINLFNFKLAQNCDKALIIVEKNEVDVNPWSYCNPCNFLKQV